MWQIYNSVIRSAEHFEMEHWLMLIILAVGLGFLCLRGFGSRSNY